MIFRQLKEVIQGYTDSTYLNQSSIKEILSGGMEAFIANADYLLHQEEKMYYEEKEHFLIGSAVDAYLSFGPEYYNSSYYFSNLPKKPTATCLSVIKMVFDMIRARNHTPIEPLLHYKEQIYYAIEEHGYYKERRKDKWEEDTRYTQLLNVKSGAKVEEQYWQDLIIAGDRQILSEMQNTTTKAIINSFLYHPHTRKFFTDTNYSVDIVFQFPIYFTYDGVQCKGLIDHIFIDHNPRKIFILDEKTIGNYITRFNRQMERLRYDIQGSFYSYGMKQTQNIKALEQLIGKTLSNYTFVNFAFIVESTKRPGTPLIFPMSDKMIEQGQIGDGHGLLGWNQGIQIYKEWEKNGFDINKVYGQNNGIVFMDETFNYVNKLQ